MGTYPERSKCGHEKYWAGNYGTCMACRAEAAESQVAALTASLASMTKERDELREVAMNGNRFTIARAESAEASLATRTEERDSYLDAVTLAESELAELRKRSAELVRLLKRGFWTQITSDIADAVVAVEALASPSSPAPVESKPKAFHECGPECYATPPAADTANPSPDKV